MAEALVVACELSRVDLPPVCVMTGETGGVRFVPVSLRKHPWNETRLALLLLGLVLLGLMAPCALTGLFLLRAIIPRIRAELPFSERGYTAYSLARIAEAGVLGVLGGLSGVLSLLTVYLSRHLHLDLLRLRLLGGAVIAVLFVVVWRTWVWGRSVVLRPQGRGFHLLQIPSGVAADAIHRRAWCWPEECESEPWSTRPAGGSGRCHAHPETEAAWICGRCGHFACEACARRMRNTAMPVCVACDALRPWGNTTVLTFPRPLTTPRPGQGTLPGASGGG